MSRAAWVALITLRLSSAAADEGGSAVWPATLGMSAVIGGEIQGPPSRNTVAFGVSASLLWKARIGGAVALLSSSGLSVPATNNQPALPDRISVPFALAGRPLAALGQRRGGDWTGRFLEGIELQAGVSVEHLRAADENQTTAGLHLALALDVPLYGGPSRGGVALHILARGIFAPEVKLHPNDIVSLFSPNASGQLFIGFCYYP